MRNKKPLILCMAALFFVGLAVFLYPYVNGLIADYHSGQAVSRFLTFAEAARAEAAREEMSVYETSENMDAVPYAGLLAEMRAYNRQIYQEHQAGLCDPWAYQQPTFVLADYGLPDGIIGVISIPAIGQELPIYLGATGENLAKGAAHLSETSLPIGGENTNCVIAAHRGWNGIAYWRYIERLAVGDEVTITNLWETLTYKVTEIKIIEPYEVEEILIQDGKDMLTLLTCHPYASGGRYRYVVYCERVLDAAGDNP